MRFLAYLSLRNSILTSAIAACLILASASVHAQDGDDPPAQAGRLSALSGTVSIQPAGSDDWGQAYPNLPLGPGDRVYTDRDGRAEIQLGQSFLRIGPNSDVTFVNADPDGITFGVAQGAVHVHSLGLWQGQSLYVQTPSGSSTVNQPSDFRIDVLPDDNAAVFTTFYGDVYVSGANGLGLNTEQGQALELIGSNPVYPQWLQPAYPDDLDRWSQDRDQQIARAASYRYVSPEIPGAWDLDANGEWMPDTDYGSMWFPNVPAGWAPYQNGHWVNRDPWGWVWVEDEPWGYAPFHFGRWISYRGRWGWVPGPRDAHPVWSPALVVFAGGIQFGGAAVSAWFPLGPGEAYHPWYRASPRYVNQVNITNIQESRFVHVQNTYVNNVTVNNVTNITNVTYINQTNGVTAMRREDMASGRQVAQAAVRIDPGQMRRVQVLARPEAVPTPQAIISRPAIRPVPVAVQRPVLINAQGKMAPAKPNARPMEPPVRTAPVARPLPGRIVVAAPPGAKKPFPPVRTPVHPGRPDTNPSPAPIPPSQPAPAPDNRPGVKPPTQAPQPQPGPVFPNRPAQPPPQPGPRQDLRPGNRPVPPTPPTQPNPIPGDRPPARPPLLPAPQPAPKPAPVPDNRPSVRPPYQPTPQPQPRQDARPAERPVPQSPPQSPTVPGNRPPARPPMQPQPAPRQAAPPPPARPNVQPQPKPAPPPQKDNRSDKEKKDEKKPPQ